MGEKNIGKLLFKEYGISEWEDKCILLSNEETISVLNALKNGEYNELVELIRLPYPKFVCEYIKLFIGNLTKRKDHILKLDKFLLQDSDKSLGLGYKLYVLSANAISMIMDYIKYPEIDIYSIIGRNGRNIDFDDIILFLNEPLDYAYKARFIENINKTAIKKYIHIMSYVDAKEAERLGLTSFTFKKFNEYRGFDIEEKLNSLNPIMRHIVMETIGLNGSYIVIDDLGKKYNLSRKYLYSLLTDEFYLAFSRSAGEFKNYLGLIDKKYEDDERREYASKSTYKKLSEKIETAFMANCLNDENYHLNKP